MHELTSEFIFLCSSIVFFIGAFLYTFFFKYDELIEGYKKANIKVIIILIITFLFGSVLANILYLKYLKHTNSNIMLIIVGLAPAITIIAAYFLLEEQLTYIQVLGTLIILIGLVIILYK